MEIFIYLIIYIFYSFFLVSFFPHGQIPSFPIFGDTKYVEFLAFKIGTIHDIPSTFVFHMEFDVSCPFVIEMNGLHVVFDLNGVLMVK
jgi:hypothetical protein